MLYFNKWKKYSKTHWSKYWTSYSYKDYHFDFQSTVKSYFGKTPGDQAINFIRKNIYNGNVTEKIIPSVPNESKDFAQEMVENLIWIVFQLYRCIR